MSKRVKLSASFAMIFMGFIILILGPKPSKYYAVLNYYKNTINEERIENVNMKLSVRSISKKINWITSYDKSNIFDKSFLAILVDASECTACLNEIHEYIHLIYDSELQRIRRIILIHSKSKVKAKRIFYSLGIDCKSGYVKKSKVRRLGGVELVWRRYSKVKSDCLC